MSSLPTGSFAKDAKGPALFLSYCFSAYIIIVGVFYSVWYLIFPRIQGNYSEYIVGLLFLSFLFVLGGGFVLIYLTVVTGIDLLYPHGKTSLTVNLLFPIATTIATVLGVNKSKLRESFVSVNNSMIKAQCKRISNKRLLILLPHCLQIDKCDRNVTHYLENCRECGRCLLGDLKRLGKEKGITINVVNGGTLARKRVADYRPTGIVAVACERDLASGILDVYPVPVIGVINDRPNGPCYNTSVDMNEVKKAIEFFEKELD